MFGIAPNVIVFSSFFGVCFHLRTYGFYCIAREIEWEKVWALFTMNERKKSHRNEHIDKSMRHKRYDDVRMCIMYNNTKQLQTFFLYTKRWFRTMFGITLLVVHCTVHIQYTWGAWKIECTMFSYFLQGFKTLFSCRERERKPMSVILVLILEKIFRNKYT